MPGTGNETTYGLPGREENAETRLCGKAVRLRDDKTACKREGWRSSIPATAASPRRAARPACCPVGDRRGAGRPPAFIELAEADRSAN